MIRRYGDAPHAGQHYRTRHGAYAILPRDGQLLLTYQGAPHEEVQLPGGGIDPGESPMMALHREVFEETGWTIARARRLGAVRRFTFMPEYDLWAEKVCHIYMAHPVRAHGEPTEENHLPIWMGIEEALASLYNLGDADFVARFATARTRA